MEREKESHNERETERDREKYTAGSTTLDDYLALPGQHFHRDNIHTNMAQKSC